MRTNIFVSCAVQIEAKGYEAAPYRDTRLPVCLAASSAALERARLRAAERRDYSACSVEFRTERNAIARIFCGREFVPHP